MLKKENKMSRSLKKGPYIDFRLRKKVDEANDSGSKGVIKTWSRRSMISPDFVGCLLYTSPSPRD